MASLNHNAGSNSKIWGKFKRERVDVNLDTESCQKAGFFSEFRG